MPITIEEILQNTAAYTAILPLSYMVPTFYPTPPGKVEPSSGAPRIRLDDPDLQARAQRLVNVLFWTATTYQNLDGMTDGRTLKVFIAPEFYFRKASRQETDNVQFLRDTSFGSYPEDARYVLAEALYGAILGSSLFRDWLIVAGTVCSVLPMQDAHRLNLLNTAIMLRGQRARQDASVPYVLMEKHYISHIDGPPQDWHANLDPSTTYSFQLNPDQNLDNLIYWDQMTVGLEVCLDHAKQVAANAMNTLSQTLGPQAKALDLQLVTSCGMTIVQQAVAVADGALILLTDGMSHLQHLQEPVFEIGRYDAAANTTKLIDRSSFQFTELPLHEDYQVDYLQGLYSKKGLRQGVWAAKAALPLRTTTP
ncbi:hypothetical protein [Paracidovorax anthurii]|uniref:Uncharacterized protein n=1 Tax=Paracidovorax anthurii TaxID=78229 RepID=A0A328Z432_9BURK|nr:hypothetical protein [Paracidovorax anthurii]RAR77547.1 hypothetical protein AX018_103627 [Paracidovorax anthurii]